MFHWNFHGLNQQQTLTDLEDPNATYTPYGCLTETAGRRAYTLTSLARRR